MSDIVFVMLDIIEISADESVNQVEQGLRC